jgi:hypothetical protein
VDYPVESFTASERTGSPPLSQDGATVRLFYGTAADSVLELAWSVDRRCPELVIAAPAAAI